MVFQGTAISSKKISQFLLPKNVAELRCSPPLLVITPETSLERPVPYVDYFAAWKLLPNVSKWVLHTVERAYRIQFGSPPPQFNGVNPTLLGPKQALVMEREVDTLLKEKEAIEVVLPHEREFGFYSRYFIVSKNYGWRVASHFRSASVEPLTLKQVVSQIRSEDWIVTIDLKDAHFHVSILPIHTHSS